MHPPDPTRRGELQGRARADLPLLVQHVLQQAPALPAAGPATVQAQALRGQLEGARAAPRRPAGGGLAHLASQPLELVQAQKPSGPRALPQLLPKGFQAWGGKRRWAVTLRPPAQGRAVRGDGHGTWGGGFPAAPGAPRPPNRFSQPRPALGLGGHPLLGFGWGQQFQHRTGTCQADHRPLKKEGHSQRHGTRGRCVPPPHPRRPGQHGRVPSDPDPLPGQQLLPGIACLWASKTSYQGPGDFVSGDQVVQA